MPKTVYKNSSMKKLTSLQFLEIFSPRVDLIQKKIIQFFSELKICGDTEIWLNSMKSELTSDQIIEQYGSLTFYEWTCNELYFDKKEINHCFKKALQLIIKQIENFLKESFPSNKFCIIASVQYGKLANINVRIHLYRENELYLEPELKDFKQPILYEFFES
ncbi:MAG: hypothetical protein J6S14_04005 [Clostridia bacterium]|nr:hypothetical protein [Clostridia bacterium]